MEQVNWTLIYIAIIILSLGCGYTYYKAYYDSSPEGEEEEEEEMFDVPEEVPQKKKLEPHTVDTTFD